MNKSEKIRWSVNRRGKRWDIWRQKKDIGIKFQGITKQVVRLIKNERSLVSKSYFWNFRTSKLREDSKNFQRGRITSQGTWIILALELSLATPGFNLLKIWGKMRYLISNSIPRHTIYQIRSQEEGIFRQVMTEGFYAHTLVESYSKIYSGNSRGWKALKEKTTLYIYLKQRSRIYYLLSK